MSKISKRLLSRSIWKMFCFCY